MEYKHKSVQSLSELYLKYDPELGKGVSPMTFLWKAVSPSIPDILKALDTDEEMIDKIRRFLARILEAMKEDESTIGESTPVP